MKTLRSFTKKEFVYKILRDARFFKKDKDLSRYARHELKDYIEYCCEHHHFIEAYSLAIQYTEDIVVYAISKRGGLRSVDAPKIMEVFWNTGQISEEFYEFFKKLNVIRNDLSHEVSRNPAGRKRISSITSHKEDLMRLIDLAEEFFLNWVRLHPGQFLFIKPMRELSKHQQERQKLLFDIIANNLTSEVDIPTAGLSKDERKVRFKEEFIAKFNQKYLELFRARGSETTK
jgi:uncharacterized protein YutE (UPF0331/DUF86 family)